MYASCVLPSALAPLLTSRLEQARPVASPAASTATRSMAARIEQAVSKSKDLKCPLEVVQRDLKDLKDYCLDLEAAALADG